MSRLRICFQRVTQLFALLLLLATKPLIAEEHRITPQMVSAALEAQGYTIASHTRTLLGRVRFVASKDLIWREIVLDLSTGQILRDYAVTFSPAEAPNPESTDMPRGGTVIVDTEFPGAGG